jgi:neuronal PAS domain-containing protein 1/3
MKDVLGHSSGREYENLIMDCCQMEDSVQTVKREETGGNDPENGSPDADRGGEYPGCLCEIGKST